MKLSIKKFTVKDVAFSEKSEYVNNIIYINKDDLIKTILNGIENYRINIEIAKPLESTRIIRIMDTVKPSYKACGGAFQGVQEGIVDMSGEGSKYSVFSKKINIVMVTESVNKETSKKDFAYFTKIMILRAAEYLAKLTENYNEYKLENYELKPRIENLPRVGYIYYIQAQGDLRNVHIYGGDNIKMNPTYFHQENPVIKEMYIRDGQEFNFSGVIVSTESSKLDDKFYVLEVKCN